MNSISKQREKPLGLLELVAIALGGMIGGGIFTILGISVAMVGNHTPVAILVGGLVALMAAYSYVKLGVYFKDEGATYSFYKKSFPNSPFAAAVIGWYIIFGYISTLALYSYTFASYSISSFGAGETELLRDVAAGAVLLLFTFINVWSVNGMGKIEDLMVYSKLVILAAISVVLIINGSVDLPTLIIESGDPDLIDILIVAAVTFVAYEGFQLVINAVNEMDGAEKNIPRAIYTSIILVTSIYVIMSLAALMAIPARDLIDNKEYALAAGAGDVLGRWGSGLVILGAVLATSSAISGTVFGASRQMAVIASDGYFPAALSRRQGRIPVIAIVTMSAMAFLLILAGGLQLILEFGSITFLLVSLLMAYANFRIRHLTGSSLLLTMATIIGLFIATVLIFYYEYMHNPAQLIFISCLYLLLTAGAWIYSMIKKANTGE
jgi:amino acid transporter